MIYFCSSSSSFILESRSEQLRRASICILCSFDSTFPCSMLNNVFFNSFKNSSFSSSICLSHSFISFFVKFSKFCSPDLNLIFYNILMKSTFVFACTKLLYISFSLLSSIKILILIDISCNSSSRY